MDNKQDKMVLSICAKIINKQMRGKKQYGFRQQCKTITQLR